MNKKIMNLKFEEKDIEDLKLILFDYVCKCKQMIANEELNESMQFHYNKQITKTREILAKIKTGELYNYDEEEIEILD